MLISVLIPTAFPDDRLDEAVRSVLAEEDLPVQVVVIYDGCSRKDADWACHERITEVFLQEKSGTPKALNRGIACVDTPFVARLDADDISEQGRLTRQHAFLEANRDVAMVGSAATLIDESGRRLGTLPVLCNPEEISKGLLTRNQFVHSSIMFRRESLLAVGGYNERCIRMQDYELFLRLAVLRPLANLPQPLVRYRLHSQQNSRNSPPWGPQTPPVLRARRRLASELGMGGGRQAVRDLLWMGRQFTRHAGMGKSPWHSYIR